MPSARRAFSLLEAVITLALVVVLAGIAVATLSASRAGGSDASARQALSAMAEDQLSVFQLDAQLATTPERLSEVDNERDFVAADASSPDSSTVSMGSRGTVLVGAARGSEGTCWYLRRDLEPPSGTPSQVWAFAPDATSCAADSAFSLERDGSGRGSQERPLELLP